VSRRCRQPGRCAHRRAERWSWPGAARPYSAAVRLPEGRAL